MANRNVNPAQFADKVTYFSPRLLNKMEGVLQAPVTVVEAPSGYGKTTALRHFFLNRPEKDLPVYWWSADDGAPQVAWARLCAELTKIDQARGAELARIGWPRLTTAWEVGETIAGLAPAAPCALVLDDFQFVLGELPRSVVSACLSYVGQNLRLVLVTQTSRPYTRAFFEQKGVNYIGVDDLRLHWPDIYQYFKLSGVPITRADAEELHRYTEGWIAALYLTVLQIGREEGFYPGRGIIQLMESIVWENTPPDKRPLLLPLALFPSLTIEQMHFLLQAQPQARAPRGDLLDLLEGTPFISYHADKKRYVPHAILREMLQRRLAAADEATKVACYRWAGAWHALMGERDEALRRYFQAGDYAAVLALPLNKLTLARVGGRPFTHLAKRLLARCPPAIKGQHPISLLRIAYSLIGAGQKEEAASLLEEIKIIIQGEEGAGERRLLEGEWMLVASFRELPNVVKMEPLLKEAAEKIGGRCRTLAADEPFAFGLPLMSLFLRKPGGMKEELAALGKVVRYLTALTGSYSGADVLLKAECAIYQGDLARAEPLCHQAFYLADGAEQWSVRVGAVNQLAQIAFKRGSTKDLTYYVKALEESVGGDALSPWVSKMLQADYYSWRGLFQLNAPWINAGKIPFTDAPDWVKAYLRYAHLVVLLQKKDYARFLGAGEAALIECQKQGYLMMEIYLHLLLAVGYYQTGRRARAVGYVQKALLAALPDRLFLPFMELKCTLADLVEEAFSTLGVAMPREIVTEGQKVGGNWQLLIRHASEKNSLPYGFTKREMEVATLAAKGMGNKEIARDLFVTESTVKYHLRAVFSKLNIDRRGKLQSLL